MWRGQTVVRGRTWGLAGVMALLVGALLATSAAATAKAARSHRRAPCSLNAGTRAPRLLKPCNGAVVTEGSVVTFVVHDGNANARHVHPFLIVALSRAKHGGELSDLGGGDGLEVQLNPVHGHPGTYSHSTRQDILVPFPGYWLDTPRTYYVQVVQDDSSASPFGIRTSPVQKLVVAP